VNPLPTTTITVTRPNSTGDPTDAPTLTLVASGAPATIGSPSGRELLLAGEQETVDAVLITDAVAIDRLDLVADDQTDDTWQVVWARQRIGLGLDHCKAGLRRVTP
jgi:hypothetical protein